MTDLCSAANKLPIRLSSLGAAARVIIKVIREAYQECAQDRASKASKRKALRRQPCSQRAAAAARLFQKLSGRMLWLATLPD